MGVATLSPARALRRPRRADPRALIGAFLTLAALAGSLAFWVGSNETRPVLVASRELPAGARLQSADLTVSYMRMDDAVYAAAVPADMLDGIVGRQLAEPVHAQQVLARAQVNDRLGLAADQVAMTIPARADTAVDGRLRPGDSVQVLLTVADKARNEAHARLVLERAQVLEVGHEQSLASSSSNDADNNGALSSVTLALSPDQARQLAEARRTGDLDILLLPPSPASQP